MEKRAGFLGLVVLAFLVIPGLVAAQIPNSLWHGLGSSSQWQNPSIQSSAATSGSGFTVSYISAPENESGDHAQPVLEPEYEAFNATNISQRGSFLGSIINSGSEWLNTKRIGVNFYKNPKAVDRNYVLSTEDISCLGDNISMQDLNASGEWYKKGGPVDSPPIEWVDDIEAVKQQIREGTFETTTYLTTLCSWQMQREAATGPSRCIYNGTLICQEKCTTTAQEGQSLDTTTEGQVEVTMSCTPDCIFFAERKDIGSSGYMPKYYGYFVLTREPLPTLEYKQTLQVVDNSSTNHTGPKIEVISPAYNPLTINKTTEPLRFILKNTGDMDAKINNLALNVPFRIVYSPTIVSAGKEEEAVLELTAETSTDLELDVDYSALTLGCLPDKDFNISLGLGRMEVISSQCLEDSDCPAKDLGLERMTCFNGVCRDPAKGFANDMDGDGYADTWTLYG
jgi:hypothetical protein